MRKASGFLIVFLFLAISPAAAFKISGFNAPESIAMDPADGAYYVSNVNGDPLAKDSNGYISKISSNGNTLIQKFIGEHQGEMPLHAPKGLLVEGQNIFVTDIDTVKGFNKTSGKPSVLVDFSRWNVKYLNDLAVDNKGLIYVSDMMTNRIFTINPANRYEVKLFRAGEDLGMPNGLVFNYKTKHLMVVTWKSGQILEIDPRNTRMITVKKGLAGLDGVDADAAGTLYVSSFQKGEIYRIPNYGRGTLTTLESGLKTPADISYDRKNERVLVPSFDGNTVETIKTIKKR